MCSPLSVLTAVLPRCFAFSCTRTLLNSSAAFFTPNRQLYHANIACCRPYYSSNRKLVDVRRMYQSNCRKCLLYQQIKGFTIPPVVNDVSIKTATSVVNRNYRYSQERRFSSTSRGGNATDEHNRPIVFAMKVKKGTSSRTNRKGQKVKVAKHRTKKPARHAIDTQGHGVVTAYSTAEEYNLEHLSLDLQAQGLFREAFMPSDAQDVLHMEVLETSGEEGEEPREIFLFREGSVVFWNVPEPLIKVVIRTIAKHETHAYEIALVTWENEQMSYTYDSDITRIADGETIILHDNNDPETTVLEKFAFSNAFALSVKLAIWEWSLDKFVTSIEWVPDNLKAGKRLKMSKEQVLRKLGELFSLRHRINLTSDLLISPDFYWNRDDLELMFTKTCNFLSISRRTKVLNEKLNHCSELVELMRTHLNEQHSFRLEWMIIALITVEVIFEIVHYIKLYVQDNVDQTSQQYEPKKPDQLDDKTGASTAS